MVVVVWALRRESEAMLNKQGTSTFGGGKREEVGHCSLYFIYLRTMAILPPTLLISTFTLSTRHSLLRHLLATITFLLKMTLEIRLPSEDAWQPPEHRYKSAR